MSKFDRLPKRNNSQQVTERAFRMVEGTFICQDCQEFVDEAKLFSADRLLVWRCPNGHTSFVEDSNL